MAPSPVRARYTNSESVFKPDIFKGKVLFCTGGGSGICKEMTYAMVSRDSHPYLYPRAKPRFWHWLDETWCQCNDRRKKVGILAVFYSMRHVVYGVLTC